MRDGRFRVEANEWGAVRLLSEAGVPFVAGPTLNIYNPETLDVLAGLGATRWLPPVEMSRDALAALLEHAPAGMETEVFAYGRLPLAFSARCFTARHYNLPKDDCQFRCLDHPDGLLLSTREGEPFLTLNGIQTQSAGVYNLIGELPALRELGIASLRLSPQSRHMGRVVEAFRMALAGEGGAAEATGARHARAGGRRLLAWPRGPRIGAAARNTPDMLITRRLEFDAGHRIPHHASHCRHLHGHRYALEITLSGQIVRTEGASEQGMVLDFSEVKTIANESLVNLWDHAFLVYRGRSRGGGISGFPPRNTRPSCCDVVPTAENLAAEAFRILDAAYLGTYGNRLQTGAGAALRNAQQLGRRDAASEQPDLE